MAGTLAVAVADDTVNRTLEGDTLKIGMESTEDWLGIYRALKGIDQVARLP